MVSLGSSLLSGQLGVKQESISFEAQGQIGRIQDFESNPYLIICMTWASSLTQSIRFQVCKMGTIVMDRPRVNGRMIGDGVAQCQGPFTVTSLSATPSFASSWETCGRQKENKNSEGGLEQSQEEGWEKRCESRRHPILACRLVPPSLPL